jgi:hypothetical protein
MSMIHVFKRLGIACSHLRPGHSLFQKTPTGYVPSQTALRYFESAVKIMAVPFEISAVSLGVSGCSLAFTIYRAWLETQSKASTYNYDYGKDIRPLMSFFTDYKSHCAAQHLPYTDAFKKAPYARHAMDQRAEEARGMLSGFWDQVRTHSQNISLDRLLFQGYKSNVAPELFQQRR